mgnify:CR=1 FL=1
MLRLKNPTDMNLGHLQVRTNESYKSVTGNEFKVTALHAGVECATFAKANKKLQLISIGPTVLNPHSPKERVDIEGVKDIYLTVSRALAML